MSDIMQLRALMTGTTARTIKLALQLDGCVFGLSECPTQVLKYCGGQRRCYTMENTSRVRWNTCIGFLAV